jgi:hypothetical protein
MKLYVIWIMKDVVTSNLKWHALPRSQQNKQVSMATVLRLELMIEHYTHWNLSRLGGEKCNFIPNKGIEECYRRAAFYCMFFCGRKDSTQRIFIKKCFLFTVGSVCRVKRFTSESRNMANVSLIAKRLKRRCGSGWDNSQKTSMPRVSTHW